MQLPATHYAITAVNEFNSGDFPEIDKEINNIKLEIKDPINSEQCLLIVTFFKDHKVRVDLVQSQATLVRTLLSMNSARHIEGLFEACKDHPHFQAEFEYYLTTKLGS